MAKLGYVRVSTSQQKLDIQIDTLKTRGVRKDRIFKDKASGKKTDRPGLERLLNRAEKGDEVLVTPDAGELAGSDGAGIVVCLPH